MKALQLLQGKHGALAAKIICGALAVFFLIVLPSSAQNRVMSPNQGEGDGVSAGGKWVVFRSEDKMTAAKNVRFELQADRLPEHQPSLQAASRNSLHQSQIY